jgi:hypothetical protein
LSATFRSYRTSKLLEVMCDKAPLNVVIHYGLWVGRNDDWALELLSRIHYYWFQVFGSLVAA